MADRIIVFDSTHQVLKTEDLFRDNDIDFDVVPLPKKFTADCGLALEICVDDIKKVEALLKSSNIKIRGIYESEL